MYITYIPRLPPRPLLLLRLLEDELPPPPAALPELTPAVVKRDRNEAALLCIRTELASSHRDLSVCSCTYCAEDCRCMFETKLSVMLWWWWEKEGEDGEGGPAAKLVVLSSLSSMLVVEVRSGCSECTCTVCTMYEDNMHHTVCTMYEDNMHHTSSIDHHTVCTMYEDTCIIHRP